MNIRGNVTRCNIAYSNENRDYCIYADFARILIEIARELFSEDAFNLELINSVYALDSSTIDLCISLFPWAKFRKNKSAIKLHTLLVRIKAFYSTSENAVKTQIWIAV